MTFFLFYVTIQAVLKEGIIMNDRNNIIFDELDAVMPYDERIDNNLKRMGNNDEEMLEFDRNFSPVLTGIKQWYSNVKAKRQAKKQKEVSNNEELDMNIQPELNKFQQWYSNVKAKRQEKRQFKKEIKQAKKEMKQAAKELKAQLSEFHDQKDELINAYMWTICQTIGFVAMTIIGLTVPGLNFLFGIFTSVLALACVASVQNLIEKRKEYKKISSVTQKEEVKKNTFQKKGLFKSLRNAFGKFKSKNQSDDDIHWLPGFNKDMVKNISLQPMNESQTDDNDIIADAYLPSEKDLKDEKEEKISISYSLNQNGPKAMSVDLSDIHTTSGLDIILKQFIPNTNNIDIKHFIVNEEDKDVTEYMEQQIEELTGCTAIYSNQVMDDEEKRVYMLGR